MDSWLGVLWPFRFCWTATNTWSWSWRGGTRGQAVGGKLPRGEVRGASYFKVWSEVKDLTGQTGLPSAYQQ
ncbi:hypothetical protein [Pyrobaculum ferrireducens]|uniref:hypothetical protein n=1 Tax=Pyrobaculum ferrireducens TaxID=1104324 RepID=UPI00130536E7|nr:hypothetical protein [Pyrobaculum ferrireducens]